MYLIYSYLIGSNKHIKRQDIYLHLVRERSCCRNDTFIVHMQ